jgi:RHS repeat-associated protein
MRIAMARLRLLSMLLAFAGVLTPAHAQPEEPARLDPRFADEIEVDPRANEALESELEEDLRERVGDRLASETDEEAPALPEDVEPTALPTGEAKSAVEPSRISLPSAEGSIEGMGESFSPVLSSGAATFSVPIALPSGRAGVQPSLGLSYGSTNGNGAVGFGWGFSVPMIVRQSDRGLPRYVDAASWTPEEDRFFYNGGQELVPVDSAAMATVDASGLYTGTDALPTGVSADWQQYRARVEGGFLRFFRSPDFMRWVVQGKDGTRFDFGLLPAGEGPLDLDPADSLQSEGADGTGRVYGWHLTRMSDAHGSTVYYRYEVDQGETYLADLYYLSPALCADGSPDATRACNAQLADYGVRVHLDYEARPDAFTRYVSGWPITIARRLARITVTVVDEDVGERFLVRRYHLAYEPDEVSFHSLLTQVLVEGRPDATVGDGVFARRESSMWSEESVYARPTPTGRTLPPMTFGYSTPPRGPISGFGGVDNTVRLVERSPDVSVDAARADLFDVNSDGLPDLVVTDPARYRLPDGSPGVGVFFNGFTGANARPAEGAATFSDPIAIGMRGSLSGVLNLGNANVVPMDVDGDGRSDLLHMPRLDRYGFFTPTRASDVAVSDAVSPARQGWRFTYAEVALERGSDPRIDFVRDGSRYKVWDVNGDHLIDVVRTTGTTMQTWLNLGWLEGGEGRFGQARWSGTEWTLSTEPYETCLLQDGLPVDFADPELRLGDMNGDGLQDLVKMRRGRIVWWPGRGTTSTGAPVFGEGPAECPRGAGANRGIVVASPPAELNVDLNGVFLADVNADGASDVVQVRFNQLDVWFSRAGESFTERVTVSAPMAPDFAPRLRFTDIDGSGTTDLVYGNASRWEYLDLLGGLRPRLLVRVDNGLGATTTIGYGSSAEDYLADLREAEGCVGDESCEAFTWSHVDGEPDALLASLSGEEVFRSGGSPVVSTVVRSVETNDRMDLVGREANVTRTTFAYHDGYYEGIEQEFRGFGAADAVAEGDADHPTQLTRTHFHQGRRPQAIATDRLAQNPYEALKGRQWLSETLDEAGRFLSSSHATIALRLLATGLDGRELWYAYVSQSDELRYDTDPDSTGSAPGSGSLTLPSVVRQDVVGGAIPSSEATLAQRTIPLRAIGYAHLRTTIEEVDNLGHVREQTAHGRITDTGGFIPSGGEAITSHQRPELTVPTGWIWRTSEQWVTGHGAGATKLGWSVSTYDTTTGDLLRAQQFARRMPRVGESTPIDYAFGTDGDAEAFSIGDAYGGLDPDANAAMVLETSTSYDAFGNALVSCVGADVATDAADCLRYARVGYDSAYAQLPTQEDVALHPGTASYCSTTVDGFCVLRTTAEWDRGFGVLRSATDPNGEETTMAYDGLARIVAVTPPDAGSACGTSPMQVFDYVLRVDDAPLSYVEARQPYDCTDALVTRSYVDGLGRARATLTLADGETSGTRWEQSGVGTFTARGTPSRGYDNAWLASTTPSPAQAVALPAANFASTRHDAFGRAIETTERDGAIARVAYRALETITSDSLDLGLHGDSSVPTHAMVFQGTSTRARMDGHERVYDQVLHQAYDLGASVIGTEYHRLFTTYRADGVAMSVTRAETASASVTDRTPVSGRALVRTFDYDSLGRRLSSLDPDADARSGSATVRHWRYLFSRTGDLVAVRDPRGCGQNFYYDWAGRLLAEDYVGCGEAQASGQDGEPLPAHAMSLEPLTSPTTQDVDVSYVFDAEPAWDGMTAAPSGTHLRGRLTGTSDRGQRSAVDYDSRGRLVWSARQMGLVPTAAAIDATLSGAEPAVDDDDAPTGGMRVYDETHVYATSVVYDRLDRVVSRTYPEDPEASGVGPVIGSITYDRRGLPHSTHIEVGTSVDEPILREALYDQQRRNYENHFGRSALALVRTETYDLRHRPLTTTWTRAATSGATLGELGAVTTISDLHYAWDAASNLLQIDDQSDAEQWPDTQKPRRQTVEHDALYRVIGIEHDYRQDDDGYEANGQPYQDWRTEQAHQLGPDPMARQPAPRLGDAPDERVVSFTYRYDWLANQVEHTDDSGAFYERMLGAEGQVVNGFGATEASADARPTALYLSSNLPTAGAMSPDVNVDRGGWLRVHYGASGNVVAMTVRARCHDLSGATACYDDATETDVDDRATHLLAVCVCEDEQHYQYRWDELNRLHEARRYDRTGGSGTWSLEVRQRYRYDGANVRTVKETIDDFVVVSGEAVSGDERVALYVMAGDYERRGLVQDPMTDTYEPSGGVTEAQYIVSGARVVWKSASSSPISTGTFDSDLRVTMTLPNLIQSTSAVVDLASGELLESVTFHPNGVRETLVSNREVEGFALEPVGFTGKEDDAEVGLVYFGERYLMPHLGRWASADPLQTHGGGGGEFGNSYHYVAGNVLQARDPNGLELRFADATKSGENVSFVEHETRQDATTQAELQRQADDREKLTQGVRDGFRELYDGMIDEVRSDESLSRRERRRTIRDLRRERRLVLRSIVGPEARTNEDGSTYWRMKLDTARIDRRRGGRTHWVYRRFREQVESRHATSLGFELEPQSLVTGRDDNAFHVRFRGGSNGIVVQRGSPIRLVDSIQTGNDVIHEVVLHSVPYLRGMSEHHYAHQDNLSGPRPADYGQDFLDKFIRGSRSGEPQTNPSWRYTPEGEESGR